MYSCGFGAMDVTKPSNFMLTAMDPKPFKFIGFRWVFISQAPVLTSTQGNILDFSFSVPYNRSPELIFVDVCSVFQAGAVGHGPGPNFGRKPAKNLEKLKYIFEFPVLSPSKGSMHSKVVRPLAAKCRCGTSIVGSARATPMPKGGGLGRSAWPHGT